MNFSIHETLRMANISNLPAEVMIHIFRFYVEIESQKKLINIISRVCPHWENLCTSRILWTKYDGTLTFAKMMLLCEKGCLNNTKELIVSKTKRLKSEDVQRLFSSLNDLKVINFSHVLNIAKDTFSVIASNCLKLSEVHIGQNQRLLISLTYDTTAQFFASRGRGLTALKLSFCSIKNPLLVLRCIADCCPNLEELLLRNIDCSSAVFPTQYFQEHCPKLKILHLDHNIWLTNKKHDSGFPNLEVFTYINATGNSSITDKGFECIAFNSPNLKFLNLTNCDISPKALCTIAACSVEYLYIARSKIINSKNLAHVFERWCHSLKEVDVSHSSDSGINKAVSVMVTACEKSEMEILNLSFTQVLPSVVEKVIQVCTKLEVLHLDGCRYLARGMKRTYRGKTDLSDLHKKLETLISSDPTVDDPVMLH